MSPPDNDDSTVAKQQWFQSDSNTDYAVANYFGVENEERKYQRSMKDNA
ncbi:MAG: hypothetical protein GY928_18030 [Colwellia sp.]|nr:hypothetical protein [Colwellia sp.]